MVPCAPKVKASAHVDAVVVVAVRVVRSTICMLLCLLLSSRSSIRGTDCSVLALRLIGLLLRFIVQVIFAARFYG